MITDSTAPSRDPFQSDQREVLATRLEQAGVPTSRAIDLPGRSKQNDHDHTNPENQLPLSEVEGNYGIMGGNGLVVLDIDSYNQSFQGIPPEIGDLPPTLTVQTPHQGEHRYYAIDVDVRSTQLQNIDVQADGRYVLGPGSVLGECRKDWHDCSATGEGEYRISDNRPLAHLSLEEILQLSPDPPQTRSHTQPSPSQTGQRGRDLEVSIAGLDTEYNPLVVFRGMKRSENGDRNRALIDGKYTEAGYPNDRSRAESALVEELGWWFEDDREVVWTIMDWICRQNPRTDTGRRRKWLERGDSWRQTLFDNGWFGNRETYNPRLIRLPGEDRPKVSYPTKRFVLHAVQELGATIPKKIVEHPRVDRGERQVQRALDELDDEGIIEWTREGNYTYYYPVG